MERVVHSNQSSRNKVDLQHRGKGMNLKPMKVLGSHMPLPTMQGNTVGLLVVKSFTSTDLSIYLYFYGFFFITKDTSILSIYIYPQLYQSLYVT